MLLDQHTMGGHSYTRRQAETAVRYRDTDTVFWELGELKDLSLAGAQFKSQCPLRAGLVLDVEVVLDESKIRIPAECVEADGEVVAVRFLELNAEQRAALGAYLAKLADVETRGTRKVPPRLVAEEDMLDQEDPPLNRPTKML